MKPVSMIALASAAVVWLAAAAGAHDFKHGELMIDHPWARPNLPNRPTAAYAEIHNAGETADRLVSASSPAFGRVEIHTTVKEGDVMKMQRVEGIEVPAGGMATLAPGGFHVMLFDASEQFAEGASFPLVFTFENAGDVVVEIKVEKRGSAAMQDHEGHGDGGHGSHGSGG